VSSPVCMECSAAAVVSIRPAGRMQEYLYTHACEAHVGKILTWMQLAGWRAATVTALDAPRQPGRPT
jgi:glucose-6-phosphate dehydrogenase assembly protein OpcA